MTYAELVDAMTKLPIGERLRMLETIARSLREEETRRGRSASEVRGLFASASPTPDDEEIKAMYAGYLIEKHR
jgi:hypothetical protein